MYEKECHQKQEHYQSEKDPLHWWGYHQEHQGLSHSQHSSLIPTFCIITIKHEIKTGKTKSGSKSLITNSPSAKARTQSGLTVDTDLMTLSIPITNEDCDISIWHREGQWYNVSVIYGDSSISTSSSLEIQGREVKETPYLIFDLKLIRPVPPSRDWTISPRNTILPRVFSVLYTIPELKITTKSILQELATAFFIWTPNFYLFRKLQWCL